MSHNYLVRHSVLQPRTKTDQPYRLQIHRGVRIATRIAEMRRSVERRSLSEDVSPPWHQKRISDARFTIVPFASSAIVPRIPLSVSGMWLIIEKICRRGFDSLWTQMERRNGVTRQMMEEIPWRDGIKDLSVSNLHPLCLRSIELMQGNLPGHV